MVKASQLDKQKGRDYIQIFGKQPVYEALVGNWPVKSVYLRGTVQDRFLKSLVALADKSGVQVSHLEPPAFDRQFTRVSQGVVAVVEDIEMVDVDTVLRSVSSGRKPFFVALDGILDPHNLGAIVRTCYAMGADAVVVPRRRTAALGEGVAKASAGAIFKLPICQVPNIHYFVEWARKNGFWVYGLDAAGSKSLWDEDFFGSVALIVGSEGKGISRLVKDKCDSLVKIPMDGNIGSLNASVAVGMAIFEVKRQRNKQKGK